MYTSITEEIIKAKGQKSIIIEHFNAKIGNRFKENMSTLTKEGRQLIKMIYKYDMGIVNEQQEICKVLSTREQAKNTSVIYFVIRDKKNLQL